LAIFITVVAVTAAACSADGGDEAGSADTTTGVTSTGAAPTTVPPAETSAVEGAGPVDAEDLGVFSYPVPTGSRPHDVAPAPDGGVWYTAQGSGELGHLDPVTGDTTHLDLGDGSAPHGVIVGPDGLAWVTDGGRNSIISYDPATEELAEYPLPEGTPYANLNTAAFDEDGRIWFTGQAGFYGNLDPATGDIEVFDSPRGEGPYGIEATPAGDIYFSSLAGSYLGAVAEDGSVVELDPPTAGAGARRVWSDSTGDLWVSEWNAGQLARYEPDTETWTEWDLPGASPSTYAVYVDEYDEVWVSDFGGNAIHRFHPDTETFDTFALPAAPSDVRQILGRTGEIWGAESANDSLVVIRPSGA
jgi:virginiamycin B lyase